MRRRHPLPASMMVMLCLLSGGTAHAQVPQGQDQGLSKNSPEEKSGREDKTKAKTDALAVRPVLRAGVLPKEGVTLDGLMSEPVWADVDAITHLTMIEPQVGGVPTGRTIVKVLASSTEIVIGVLCNDPDPSGIISNSKARDAELDDEDHITIILDTFRDGRNGYVFAVNPSGTRFDGLVTAQGTDVNSNWDTVWEARTARDEHGWSVEIRLPIKSLGFNPGLSSWGLNVERRIERLQETTRWAGASNDYEIFQTSQAGVLTELPRFDVGLGLSIRPAITAGAKKLVGVARDRIHDVSLDVTQKLGANLLSSLTVNTDFAETEVDVRQTNLTRFEILFPEKRAFFLEGADIFDFGMGMNGVLIPFFSRRVGLTDAGVPVPINAGGKVNGRVGDTSVAALVAGTRPVAGLVGSDATMGAARIKQNIFSESSVGMIATFGDQLGRPGSWMTGGDYTYQTSKFHGDKNLLVGAWGLINRRNDVAGDKTAYGFGVMYPNDRWKFNLTSARIGNGFDPSLGFVPRNGVDVWQASAGFDPRPGKAGIRQMLNGTDLLLVNDLTNRWESYTWKIRPLDWLLESGDRFGAAYSRVGDRPPANFAIFQSDAAAVFIPAGSSEWERHSVTGASAPKRPISASVTWESGGFYGGTLDSVELALAVRRSLFKVELGAERHAGSAAGWTAVNEDTDVKIRGGRFIQRLYNCRAEIKFSPDLQLASFVQYDNESALLGTNTRLRWTFHSFGDLFVVYNHNLKRAVNALNRQIFEFDSNVLMVKLQYAWRP